MSTSSAPDYPMTLDYIRTIMNNRPEDRRRRLRSLRITIGHDRSLGLDLHEGKQTVDGVSVTILRSPEAWASMTLDEKSAWRAAHPWP